MTATSASCEMTTGGLLAKKCRPCEGGVPKLTPAEIGPLLKTVAGWKLTEDGERIRKEWTVRHFRDALAFFHRIAWLAEEEGHHPDLHLTGFRHVAVELWTHAIGGLSENDFILAAKIDTLPVEQKTA
jgi:4a-hydroxytetrahydrobiopterin dehydratase